MKDKRNIIFASNVRAERHRKDYTQFELAEIVGISESTMSLIERGLQTPSAFVAYDIAKALNIDLVDLFKGFE